MSETLSQVAAVVKYIIAKKKFGKIWKIKLPVIEKKGIFAPPESPDLAKARLPRVLQTLA